MTANAEIRELVNILMESDLYFEVPPAERLALVKHLLQKCRPVP
jgi:hypothetical protein